MKIFYTILAGGPIYKKTLLFGIGFRRLKEELDTLSTIYRGHGLGGGPKQTNLFGLNGKAVHSVFIQDKENTSIHGDYKKWDSINGWPKYPHYARFENLIFHSKKKKNL